MATGFSAVATAPGSTSTWRRKPSTKDSTSMSTLSVSTARSGSPRSTFSPGCFHHFSTVASLVVWPKSGRRITWRISELHRPMNVVYRYDSWMNYIQLYDAGRRFVNARSQVAPESCVEEKIADLRHAHDGGEEYGLGVG